MTAFSSSRIRLLGELGTVTAQTDVNVILILGESTARQHLSVYGYPRKTTPFLDSLDNAVVYRDIISSHSHTNESLSRALTFNQRGSYSSFAGQLDLLSVANAAGVDTYWFSNQNTIGIWDNSVSVISAQAKESRYHDPSSGFRRTREIYDRALVVTLKELLHRSPTGSKLIVLHMMATHFPYCDVVPQDYLEHALVYDDPPMDERFFGAWIGSLASSMNERQLVTYFSSVNCYDRAVNYADSIVAEVIEYVQKLNTPTAVLYTADHGEAVIYNSGHESRMHSHLHVEVPFVFWHNPEFKNQIHLDPSRKASLEDLSYSIADLLSISGIDRVSQRSIFSEHYTEIPRKTLDGRVGYDVFDSRADSSERTRANLFTLNQSDFERVWAHRVNSGGTMMETKELFFGIEMDLVFEGSVFNVHHPPRPAVGLTLEMQLNQDRVGIEYWLDWKNASNENIDAAVARLEELDQSRKFKQRALVEISALDGSAQVLVENGWRTAYYLPTQRIGDCIRDCTEAEKKSLAVELWSNFDDGGFNAVSFDIVLLTFIDNHMLKRIRQERIPAYSWATEIDISLEDAPEKLEPLLKHGWINALLVTMPSHFRL